MSELFDGHPVMDTDERPTAEVYVLPGIERRDLGEDCPTPQVLQNAIDQGVTGAIVVGTGRDGQLFIAAENADVDAVVGKLMRAVTFLSSCEIVEVE